MSDNEGAKGKASAGWSDRERLAYLVSLIEHSDTKLSFKTAPLPAGRSVIACERMFGRLKITLAAELEALKAGTPMPTANGGDTPKATPKKTATPRKRKDKEDGKPNGEAEGSPTKKGRGKPKKAAAAPAAEDDEEVVKNEVKEEEAEEM